MSQEETAVRTAYARLAFATETSSLLTFSFGPTNAVTIDAALSKEQLRVVLSSFKVGAVTDLAGHFTFADLADSPQTPLTVAVYKPQWQDEGGLLDEMAATAKWASTPNPNAGFLLPLTTYAKYGDSSAKLFSRYATYVATVTLGGETRSARATIVFDPQGRVAIVDEMIGAPLIPFFAESVYPHILLEPVRNFL